ncbi:zinc-binding alcohol dehydrogenase family protein [Nonomuraea sp. NPDC050556]|uniref:zinc-binding alcohol dehydrogenase family protein n=1 Tax=Nonomuraea sp. NPDC050556 TaxID=3364369 RepID=UPI0037A9AF3B
MRAVQATRFGGPEVLEEVELPDPVPGDGQVVVDVEAAGINFADIKQLEGVYQPPQLPFTPGSEVVGRLADGRRVMAFAGSGYASKALAPAQAVIEIPEELGAGEALALLVQGLSAWHLLRSSARLAPGESVVVNSAAGGVGTLAVQLAKKFGAGRVIGTASSDSKRAVAASMGADAVIDGEAAGYAERVIAANGGKVDIILDAVGGPVFDAAIGALAPFGRVVSYGTASGVAAQALPPGVLMQHNIAAVGFWLGPLMGQQPGITDPLGELISLTLAGELRPLVGGEYPLSDAGRALTDMASRQTTGKLILRP